MTKIEAIQFAISEANLFRSKLSPEALAVPGYTSLKIRHLMNNLGAISSNYLEIGVHKGGTFCSAIFGNNNLAFATAVDSFVEFNEEGSPMKEFLSNAGMCKSIVTGMKLIAKDCWEIVPVDLPQGIDLYLYDGGHGFSEQLQACTHYLDSMADEFIFLVDDYSAFGGVKDGTTEGIKKSGCEILFEQELYNGIPGDNFGFHNGFYVSLLKKK